MADYKAQFNNEPRVGILNPGDILLKRNLDGFKSDPIGNTISFMQMITMSSGDNLPGAYVSGHAAIFVGGDQVAEATGAGVSLTNLNQEIKYTRYLVYRCFDAEAANRAAQYARRLTERRQGVNGNFLDGNYALGKAFASLATTRHMGDRGQRLMNHVNQYVTGQNNNLAVPDFFCSMFVYTVFEVALENNERFGFDPYSVDPKFYHKILDTSHRFQKLGKYIHVISNGVMRQECFNSVREAITNYDRIRANQSFKSFRRVSDETTHAKKVLQDCVEACRNRPPEGENYDLLVGASLYFTRSASEIPKFFPEVAEILRGKPNYLEELFGRPLTEGSTFLQELDKTSFFRRLRSVRKS